MIPRHRRRVAVPALLAVVLLGLVAAVAFWLISGWNRLPAEGDTERGLIGIWNAIDGLPASFLDLGMRYDLDLQGGGMADVVFTNRDNKVLRMPGTWSYQEGRLKLNLRDQSVTNPAGAGLAIFNQSGELAISWLGPNLIVATNPDGSVYRYRRNAANR